MVTPLYEGKPYVPKYFSTVNGWGCWQCGAVVADIKIHDKFHSKLDLLFEQMENLYGKDAS